MRTGFATCLLLVVMTLPLAAGPWPRETGNAFLAVTGSYRFSRQTMLFQAESALYAEYGVSKRLTLGADGMTGSDGYAHAFGFARWHFGPPDRQLKLAASLGVGASRRDGLWGGLLRLAGHVGRPVQVFRPGWWMVTAAIEDHQLWPDPLFKLDASMGLTLTPRLKSIVDLETSRRAGTSDSITLRASVAWAFKPHHSFVVGLEAQDAGIRSVGMRAGFWRRF